MIKTLDVTAQVLQSWPSAFARVAISAGSLTVTDSPDNTKRDRLVAALALQLLTDPSCSRQRLDERRSIVRARSGPRFVVINGEETIALVSLWEWVMHGGAERAPEIEVVNPDGSTRRLA